MCHCPQGMSGNAFVQCQYQLDVVDVNPCSPSPCGPYSQCRTINGQAICACLQEYVGNPPMCRPECVQNNECMLNEACLNQKCRNPCIGTCGVAAICSVINHKPICSCPSRYEGNPFALCQPMGNTKNCQLH